MLGQSYQMNRRAEKDPLTGVEVLRLTDNFMIVPILPRHSFPQMAVIRSLSPTLPERR